MGQMPGCSSAEREAESFDASVQKLDLKPAVGDRLRLPDQLIGPLVLDSALSLPVDVGAMSCSGRPAVEQDTKSRSVSLRRRSHDQVQVASVELERDPPAGLVQGNGIRPDGPVAGE